MPVQRTDLFILAGGRRTGRTTVCELVLRQAFGRRLFIARNQDHAEAMRRRMEVDKRDPRLQFVGPSTELTGRRYDAIVVDVGLERTDLRPLLWSLYSSAMDQQGGLLLATVDGGPVPDRREDIASGLVRLPPDLEEEVPNPAFDIWRRTVTGGDRIENYKYDFAGRPVPWDFNRGEFVPKTITRRTPQPFKPPKNPLRQFTRLYLPQMRAGAIIGSATAELINGSHDAALVSARFVLTERCPWEAGWALRVSALAQRAEQDLAPRLGREGLPAKLDDRSFEQLREYSFTNPTGAKPGDRWRRRIGARWAEVRVLHEPHPDGGFVIEAGWIVR